MKTWIAGLFSDGHGQPDEQALISVIGAAVFFGLEIYTVVVHGQNFDPLAFGAGVGTLMGATSAGFGLRARLSNDPANNGGNNAGNNP
jgi:hypothetical protein